MPNYEENRASSARISAYVPNKGNEVTLKEYNVFLGKDNSLHCASDLKTIERIFRCSRND